MVCTNLGFLKPKVFFIAGINQLNQKLLEKQRQILATQ